MADNTPNRSKSSKVDKAAGPEQPRHEPTGSDADDREDDGDLVDEEDRITQRTPAQRERDAAEPMTHQPPNK